MSLSFSRLALLAAFLSIVVGYVTIQSNKNESGYRNFTTWDFARLAVIIIAVILAACYTWLRQNYPNWWTDFQHFTKLVKWDLSIKAKMKSGLTIMDVFDRHVHDQPDHPCILYKDEVYTYAEVDEHANRVARWVINTDPNLEKGESIGLLLHNGPEFAWICMGLMKLGVVPSLLNTNLKPTALLHCMQVCEAKKLIFGEEHLPVVSEIIPELVERNVDAWMIHDAHVQDAKVVKVPPQVVTMDTSMLSGKPYSRDAFLLTDMAVYIFTSGTTGMPKPVNVLHRKIIRATYLHFFSNLTPDDVYYIALPLYHSAALLQGTFSIWYYGGTVAIAKKFSASRFWDDIRKHRATCFHYVGELCRYLLAQPKKENDGVYPREIRLAQGNGLRPEIWSQFQERFKVGKIFEIYAATEGNFGFINIDGKVGTVGRYPWFMKKAIDSVEIVDYDYASGEPKRGANGMCVLLPNGRTGLALIKISVDHPYTGYKGSREMSYRKVTLNVKKTGDMYFNTGDLLMLDEDGYVYFKDRVGDTFRWKGENVSTMEVSQVVSTCNGVLEASVYGVKIPGQDGRAGMVAIVMQDGCQLDCGDLYAHVINFLPDYACPKFVRVMDKIEITGTFKHKKFKLVEEGWDMEIVKDRMYVIDVAQRNYKSMTNEHAKMILDGRLKL